MGILDIFSRSSKRLSTGSPGSASSPAAAAAPASQAHKGPELVLTHTFEYDQFEASKSHEALFMTTLQAPEFEPEGKTERAALDLCVVVDKSGSMSGAKIDLVRKTLLFMVDQLKKGDRLAIVGFDSNITLDLALVDVVTNKSQAKKAIEHLKAGSCTNLSGGLFKGIEVLKQRGSKCADVSSILLFTDGLANEGITDAQEIVRQMDSMLSSFDKSRPTVYTFGFGADHSESMLTQIAQSASGMYYFVKGVDEIAPSFGDALGGLVSCVAQNIKIKLEALGDINGSSSSSKIIKMVSTYGRVDEASKTDTQLQVTLNDAYSEERRDLIFLVKLPECAPTSDGNVVDIVKISLEYFSVVDNSFKSAQYTASVARPATVDIANLKSNEELDKQRNRIKSTEALLRAKELADQGKLEEAKQELRSTQKQILDSVSAQDAYCQNLVLDMNNQIERSMQSESAYAQMGSKAMSNAMWSHSVQRSAAGSAEQEAVYQSKAKKAMKAKFSAM